MNDETPTGPELPGSDLGIRGRLTGFALYLIGFQLFPVALALPLYSFHFTGAALQRLLFVLYCFGAVLSTLLALRWTAQDRSVPSTFHRVWISLRGRVETWGIEIWAGIGSYFGVMPLILLAFMLSSVLFPIHKHPIIGEFVKADEFTRKLMFVETVFLAPVVEELMFRGLLFTALRDRYGLVFGMIVSGLAFAAVHPGLPGQLLPLWTLGIAFAGVYHWRRSILANIALHMTVNGVTLLLALSQLK